MAYFNTCIRCGANLDPGEICECKEKIKKTIEQYQRLLINPKTGQMSFDFGERKKDAV